MFGADGWSGTGSCYDINYGSFTYSCQPPAGQDIFILSPYQAALPLDYTMQGVCVSGCATPPVTPTLDSVSPASGASGGTAQVVLHGTGLNLGDAPYLSADGSAVANGQAVAVNSDGTELTARLGLSDVPAGVYDVSVQTPSYAVVTLPGAYTVTAGAAAAASASPRSPPRGFWTPEAVWARPRRRSRPAGP